MAVHTGEHVPVDGEHSPIFVTVGWKDIFHNSKRVLDIAIGASELVAEVAHGTKSIISSLTDLL